MDWNELARRSQEMSKTSERAEKMSNQELMNAYRNSNSSDERAVYNQEARYRTGKDERPSGGCFITTAVCDNFGKSDDCYELTTFRNFRDKWLINQSDGKSLIDEYYEIAPKIVDKINHLTNAGEIYQSIWTKYLKPCLSFIENGDNQNCKTLYIDMVKNLREKFLG